MLTVTKGGVTLASSTSSQEDLNAALGLSAEEIAANAKEAQEQKEATPAAVVPDDKAGTAPDSDPDEQIDESQLTEEQKEQHGKRKSGWARRDEKRLKTISTLEETLAEERRARQLLEARLAGNNPAATVEKAAVTEDAEPTEEGLNPKTGKAWKDWKEFNAAHTNWVMDQREKSAASAKVAESDQQHVEKTWTEHTERLAAAQTKYADWNEVAQDLAKMQEQQISIPQPVALAIIELENGPDVLYKLAKDPELVQKLQKMSEVRAIAEIGRIAASIETPSEKKEVKTGSPDPKPKSAAPEPITPVGSSVAKSATDPSKLPLAEYVRQRNAGLLK